jgi:hypothetical protein
VHFVSVQCTGIEKFDTPHFCDKEVPASGIGSGREIPVLNM